MKLSVGRTVKEAVCYRPITNIRSRDESCINLIRNNNNVVLNYKEVQGNACRFYWVFKACFTYMVLDRKTGKYVTREDDPNRIKYFKSIYRAMEWIYDNDKEYYNSLENISTKEKEEKI